MLRGQLVKNIEQALRAGDDRSVRQAFSLAFESLPDDALLRAKWAEYLLGCKDPDALAVATEAFRYAGGNHKIRMALCSQLFRAGFRAEAHTFLPERVREETVDHLFLRLNMALDRAELSEAKNLCRALLKDGNIEVLHLRGLVKVARRQSWNAIALEACEQLVKKPAAKAVDHASLLAAYKDSRAIDAAKRHLASVPRQLLGHPAVLEQRASLCLHLGDNKAAYQLFLKLIDQAPGHPDAWTALAEIAPREELPSFAARVEKVFGDIVDRQAQMIVTFAIGTMHDRLGNRQKSFDAYQRGNQLLKTSYADAGKNYEPGNQEVLHRKICEFFPTRIFEPTVKSRVTAKGQFPTPIFVVGMPRSGTSLLERMLAAFDSVSAGGESPVLGKLAFEHLSAIQQRDDMLPINLSDEFWQERAKYYESEMNVKARFVTDKMPQNYRNLGWALKMFPHAPVIHLRRDPRDVAWSMFKRAFRATFAYSADMEDLAHAVMMSERYMSHWKSVAPERILTVCYEDIVRDPEAAGKSIARHCGLEWDPRCLTPEELDIPCYTLSKVQVRQPINPAGVGQWRAYEDYLHPFIKRMEAYGFDL